MHICTSPGRSIVVWVQTARRLGACHVGPVEAADLEALAALQLPVAPPCDVLHDAGALEIGDRFAFERFEAYLARWSDLLAARTRRLAVVRPNGFAGAVVTGLFHDRLAPRFDAVLCHTRDQAYASLAIDDRGRNELEALRDAHVQPTLLRRVRGEIAAHLSAATLDATAAALAITPRTLQRQLALHGTSFRHEVSNARIRAAEAMLLEREAKVEAIARELGFGTSAAFSAMFHRMVGLSPTAFRLNAGTK